MATSSGTPASRPSAVEQGLVAGDAVLQQQVRREALAAPAGARASSSTASSQSLQVATRVARSAVGSAAYGSRRSSSAEMAAVIPSSPAAVATAVMT